MLIKKILKKLSRMIFHTNSALWFERDLSQPFKDIIPKVHAEINFFSREEAVNWLKKHNERWVFNKREAEIASKENHYYPYVKHSGEIIGYIKVGLRRVYIEDYRKVVSIPGARAFIYDTYVLPSYRGNDIAAFMITEAMKFLKARGIEKVNCHIPAWNTASIKVYTKAGFERIAFMRHLRVFNSLKFEIASAAPAAHPRNDSVGVSLRATDLSDEASTQAEGSEAIS